MAFVTRINDRRFVADHATILVEKLLLLRRDVKLLDVDKQRVDLIEQLVGLSDQNLTLLKCVRSVR